jgi:hypothetical protein
MDFKESIEITEKVRHDVVTIDEGARRVERNLRMKIDFFVVPTVTLLYLMCFIDRTNIGWWLPDHEGAQLINSLPGNARLAGFEKDLKLKGYDYNTVLSVFYISYIIFEIPSTICCKVMGMLITWQD